MDGPILCESKKNVADAPTVRATLRKLGKKALFAILQRWIGRILGALDPNFESGARN